MMPIASGVWGKNLCINSSTLETFQPASSHDYNSVIKNQAADLKR